MKPYAIGAIILLLGLAFWYHGNSNYQSGVNAERVRWQELEISKNQEILELQKQIADQKQEAEKYIQAERKVWESRIDALKSIPSPCVNPDILRELRASGIYTGRIPCQ